MMLFPAVYWKTRARTRGHGQADTDTDTYGKDGHLWKRRAVMEKTGSYGKDGHLRKRRTLMEKTDTYGKDGHLWKLNGCRTCLNQLQTKFTNKNINRVNNTCSFCIYCEWCDNLNLFKYQSTKLFSKKVLYSFFSNISSFTRKQSFPPKHTNMTRNNFQYQRKAPKPLFAV